jgi:hypothetical protein
MATATSTSQGALVTTGDVTIPITVTGPGQSFLIDLEENTYEITLRWLENAGKWYMRLKGISTDEDFVGIALVGGVNLLRPFAITTLGALYVVDTTGANLDPDFDTLGVTHILYYVPTTNPDGIA